MCVWGLLRWYSEQCMASEGMRAHCMAFWWSFWWTGAGLWLTVKWSTRNNKDWSFLRADESWHEWKHFPALPSENNPGCKTVIERDGLHHIGSIYDEIRQQTEKLQPADIREDTTQTRSNFSPVYNALCMWRYLIWMSHLTLFHYLPWD